MSDKDISVSLDVCVGKQVPALNEQTHFVNGNRECYFISIFSSADDSHQVQEEFEAWKSALAALGITEETAKEFQSYVARGHCWHTHLFIIKKQTLENLLQAATIHA